MPSQAVSQDSLIGLEFGHYRILERIGRGGMGVVYRSYDAHLEREVAIKVLDPGSIASDHSRTRFRNEARTLSKLNHPNVATVHDFDTQLGRDFLVMEFIQGANLADKLASGPLPEQEILRLGTQLCDGLAAAHSHGIIHRDLKPGNLRLTADHRLKILDFGLALLREPRALGGTRDSTICYSDAFAGTLPYMAPEQLNGDGVDARTDIYAAGLVLYEMATGQRPFAELHSSKLIGAILRNPPIPPTVLNPKISPDLERIVGRCLEKEPENRYQSALELGLELRYCETAVRPRTATLRTSKSAFAAIRPRRRWPVAQTSILALASIALLLAYFVPSSRWHLSRRPPIPITKQLAVLPFDVSGTDAETAAFAAGLTETLTAKLTQMTQDRFVQVVPAPEIRSKRVATANEARVEFGVNLVLEGNLHKSGNQIRINCILVDPQSLRQLRASTLTFTLTDPFEAEDAVVNNTIEMLDLDSRLQQHRATQIHGTQVASAYDYYLQGRGYLQNYDRVENLDSAIQVFQRALTFDKNYALAYTGLGEAYRQKFILDHQPLWLEKSRDSCRTASHLDPASPAVHTCLGNWFVETGNYNDAAKEFSLVLQNEPTNDAAYSGLANAYQRLGKLQDAEDTFKRAITLRPHYWATYNWLGVFYYRQARFHQASAMFRQVVALAPDSIRGYYNLAASSLDEGQYGEAIRAAQRSIELHPTDYGYTNLGNAYLLLKRYDEAVVAFELATRYSEDKTDPLVWWNLGDGYYWATGRRENSVAAYEKCSAFATQNLKVNPKDVFPYGALAVCQAMLGQKDSALAALNKGFQLSPDDPYLMFQAALVHVQFGEREETLRWLAKCRAAGHSPNKIRDYPNFQPLHSDPRFQEILQAH